MKSSFVGSFVAMFVGAFSVFSGFQNFPYAMDNIVGGATAILGALAYRSAKQRRLGVKRSSSTRRRLELVALALVILPIPLLFLGGVDVVVTHPASSIIVPVWTVIAFLWVSRRAVAAEEGVPSIR